MLKIKIQSFNVNGIRAAFRKGVGEWLKTFGGDIVGLQETKAWEEQLSEEIRLVDGYNPLLISKPSRKGYSGVGIYSKLDLMIHNPHFFGNHFDLEGRVNHIQTRYFDLLNVYFPNGASKKERLDYKMEFYSQFLHLCKDLLKKGKKLIVMGDVNTAYQPIDLAHPKENEAKSGFLPTERDWITQFLDIGMIDTFRHFYPDKKDSYSWWDMKTFARERNVGWRIDYIFVSHNLLPFVQSANILSHVLGSDHCPVELVLNMEAE